MLNPKTPAAVVVVFPLLQIGDVLQLMPKP
jgi:hypothetical protein